LIHQLASDLRAAGNRQVLQVTVETDNMGWGWPRVTRTVTTVNRRDSFLLQRRVDPDRSHVHVEHVGVDPTLDDLGRQAKPLCCQELNQELGYDTTAVVAPCWALVDKVARLVDVDVDVETDRLGHLEKKETKKGPRRPTANDSYARSILKRDRVKALTQADGEPILDRG
jgi:hypothetical protein